MGFVGTWEIQTMGKGVAAGGEGLGHKSAGQVIWKSDEAIVVMKRANKNG
jgi:hypothetical protein